MSGERLLRCVANGGAPHAILIAGPAGSGRAALARRAAALYCLGEDAPERLSSCPDYAELTGDGVGVEQMRAMTASANVRTFSGGGRAFVITDAHLMSLQVQNTLLKTLEEPPAGTLLLLCGAEAGLLPTIRSRCMIERLGAISVDEVRHALLSRGTDADDAETLAAFSDGVPGRAEPYLSAEGKAFRAAALDALEQALFGTAPFAQYAAWTPKKSGDASEKTGRVGHADQNARNAVLLWESMLHDALRLSVGAPLLQNPDRPKLARRIAADFTSTQIEDMIEDIVGAQEMLYNRANPQFTLDALTSKLLVSRMGERAK